MGYLAEEGYAKEDNVVGKHRLIDLGGKHIHEILTSLSDAVRPIRPPLHMDYQPI